MISMLSSIKHVYVLQFILITIYVRTTTSSTLPSDQFDSAGDSSIASTIRNVNNIVDFSTTNSDLNNVTTTATESYVTLSTEDDANDVPSKPLNVTVLNVTATTIKLAWREPKHQNGAIIGYHILPTHDNQTGVEIIKDHYTYKSYIHYTLGNLKPFTEYKIIVKAVTNRNVGEPSDPITQRTDISGPSEPIIVNLTCHSQDALNLRWRRPLEYFNSIDFYVVHYRIAGHVDYRNFKINASSEHLETSLMLPNLTTNSIYEVKVRAATISTINTRQIILGPFTPLKRILMQPNCEKIQPLLRQSHNDYNLAVLVGVVFSCFGIILIIMAFVLWRKKLYLEKDCKREILTLTTPTLE